jgi:hypothetical protein
MRHFVSYQAMNGRAAVHVIRRLVTQSGIDRSTSSFLAPLSQFLSRDEQGRNQEDSKDCGCEHAAEYGGADGMPGNGPGAMGDDKRE